MSGRKRHPPRCRAWGRDELWRNFADDLRLGMTIRERSGCVSVVVKQRMVATCPAAPTIAMYSPPGRAWQKMIRQEATSYENALGGQAMPAPATTDAAISGKTRHRVLASAMPGNSAKLSSQRHAPAATTKVVQIRRGTKALRRAKGSPTAHGDSDTQAQGSRQTPRPNRIADDATCS